ncbi:uncharacterized protein B0P05DRAFT_557740 [Gilbertella persicaria]|uniref:uncharacterized protein n=1 Tax=Gilbertella persicaria TaxID=101096 RepID=UPI00221EBBD5|nr:uncharacterized protein B0P05DRAFT_557740 [Gilbertella persicaria]KAI8060658.1 hypothetical protein B0P05DRAFT_557740 [Gilbertella persicaria]
METSSTSQEATHSPTRTVRTNWLRYSWSQISSSSKILLIASFIVAMIQIAATITVLVIGAGQALTCDKPFQLYLIIFVVRVGLSLPLSIYQLLFTSRRTTAAAENEASSSHLISGWADKAKSLLDLFAILWFIVGNYLLFSPSDCLGHAALYYYTILAWILFGYMIVLVPLLACASIIFCLPCVLVALRAFNINISNVMVGGSKEEIANIPVFKYKKPEQEDIQDNTNKSIMSTAQIKKPHWIRRFMQRHQKNKQEEEQVYETMTLSRPEDAVCSICLCEYEDEDLICKLWYVSLCVYGDT